MSLPCVENNAHGKVFLKELHLVYSECVGGEKTLPCAIIKTHGKQDLCRAFFQAHGKQLVWRAFFLCRALYKKRTANKLFAVRPI
jgi:hypothetical protein